MPYPNSHYTQELPSFWRGRERPRFFSPKGGVFATMTAVFWNKTVLDFWTVQELALKHKAGRTGRWAEGHSHREWCFYCFCFHHINFRKLNHQILHVEIFKLSL